MSNVHLEDTRYRLDFPARLLHLVSFFEFKETSFQLGRIIKHLKKIGLYNKTDIYLYGDHGDSHYAFSEASGDITLQHATTPFHTSTHVPLVVKNNYLIKEERYDLVSHMDVYSTILNSLGSSK